jgi:hypothetical protein
MLSTTTKLACTHFVSCRSLAALDRAELKGNALTMSMMALNLALLFVFRFASVQFLFWCQLTLLHGFSEFIERLLNLVSNCRHVARYSFSRGSAILPDQFRIITLIPSKESERLNVKRCCLSGFTDCWRLLAGQVCSIQPGCSLFEDLR